MILSAGANTLILILYFKALTSNVLLYYSQIAVNIHGLCLDNRSAYGVKYVPLFWGHRTLSFVSD